jgi:type IV secretion system protein VirB6
MGFFTTFSTWLNGILSTYIGTNTTKIAMLITPAVATLATVYVMVWGYLHLTGKIEEPFAASVKRIILLVVVLGCALNLWLYNDLIVDTFFNSPGELAAGVIGFPWPPARSCAARIRDHSCGSYSRGQRGAPDSPEQSPRHHP